MNNIKRFSYARAIVCGLLTLTSISFAHAAPSNLYKLKSSGSDSMGITVGAEVSVSNLINLGATESKNAPAVYYYSEKTTTTAVPAPAAADLSGPGIFNTTISATTDTSKTNSTTATLERDVKIKLGAFVAYNFISAGDEGGLEVGVKLQGGVALASSDTIKFSKDTEMKVKAPNWTSTDSGKAIQILTDQSYYTADDASSTKIISSLAPQGNLGLVIGYNFGGGISTGIEIRGGGEYGSYKLDSAKTILTNVKPSGAAAPAAGGAAPAAPANAAHFTNTTTTELVSSGTSDSIFRLSGSASVYAKFEPTDSIEVAIRLGANYQAECEVEIKDVKTKSSSVTTVTTAGSTATLGGGGYNAATNARYFDAAHARLAANAPVVNIDAANLIGEKTDTLKIKSPSSINFEAGIRIGVNF